MSTTTTPSLSDLPDVLTPAEVRDTLRVKRTICYQLLRAGTIPSFRVGRLRRIHRDDLIAYMRQQGKAA